MLAAVLLQHPAILCRAVRLVHTFPLPSLWRLLHVPQQLHEVAPQRRHGIRWIAGRHAPNGRNRCGTHLGHLIVEGHNEGTQAAQKACINQGSSRVPVMKACMDCKTMHHGYPSSKLQPGPSESYHAELVSHQSGCAR